MPVPVLQATKIGRREGPNGTWLLRDVSLDIRPGDRLGLAGPSGSGKTLLLRTLARLDPLDEGEVRWHGDLVHGGRVPAFRACNAYLHQRPVLSEGTVEDNLRLPFTLRQHRRRRFDRDRVIHWLRSLGRDESFLNKRHQDLSGGESQLAGLLRVLELEPQVLLLDEPTAALDRQTAELVEQLIHGWLTARPAERAYVWVSHDTHQTERMCGAVVRMNHGRVES